MCFKVYVTENDTALTLPTGYTKSCKIGHVYNDATGNFFAFIAQDRTVYYGSNATNNLDLYLVNALAPPAATTLVDAFTKLPPCACTPFFTFQLVTGGILNLGPVPFGYGLNGAPADYFEMRYDVASSHVTPASAFTTDYQGFYIYNTTGTAYLLIRGYTW
jgi:hypothetical protein